MRILVFVSVLGILICIGVLMLVIIKSNKTNTRKSEEENPPGGS